MGGRGVEESGVLGGTEDGGGGGTCGGGAAGAGGSGEWAGGVDGGGGGGGGAESPGVGRLGSEGFAGSVMAPRMRREADLVRQARNRQGIKKASADRGRLGNLTNTPPT